MDALPGRRYADHPLHARRRVPSARVAADPATGAGLRPGQAAARELRAGAAGHRAGRDRDAGRRADAVVRVRGRHGVRVQRHGHYRQAVGVRTGERSEERRPQRSTWTGFRGLSKGKEGGGEGRVRNFIEDPSALGAMCVI